jgi:hypothetical protein
MKTSISYRKLESRKLLFVRVPAACSTQVAERTDTDMTTALVSRPNLTSAQPRRRPCFCAQSKKPFATREVCPSFLTTRQVERILCTIKGNSK